MTINDHLRLAAEHLDTVPGWATEDAVAQLEAAAAQLELAGQYLKSEGEEMSVPTDVMESILYNLCWRVHDEIVQMKAPHVPSSERVTTKDEIAHLHRALTSLMDSEELSQWLGHPNPVFSGKTPLEIIEDGEIDRLWRMVYELKSGNPG